MNLLAEEFWALLRDEVRPTHLVEGNEFNFGKGRGGNINKLREWSSNSQIKLHIVDEVEVALMDRRVVPVSSTVVRWLIAYGRVRDAAVCLGRPYALRGTVIKGFQRGREFGIPTANLKCEEQLVPPDGVYAGRCIVDGRAFSAALSIGTMPTFGSNERQIEAHLIGFNGDLYDRALTVDLIDWLREQQEVFERGIIETADRSRYLRKPSCALRSMPRRRIRKGGRWHRAIRSRQMFFISHDLGDVSLDPLVIEQLAHQHPAVTRRTHLLAQGIGALLSNT